MTQELEMDSEQRMTIINTNYRQVFIITKKASKVDTWYRGSARNNSETKPRNKVQASLLENRAWC